MRRLYLMFFVVLLAWIAVISSGWSTAAYWPDADGYTSHVAEGRWVAHPPGYPFFVAVGHGFHALGLSPYQSVQGASLALAVAGILGGFILANPYCGTKRAGILAAGLAFSWVTLLILQSGTSHAADLFTVTLLLITALKLPADHLPKPMNAIPTRADMGFAMAIVICAGFRFTTLVMMAPFFLCVAWFNRKRPAFWIACITAGFAVMLLQLWVIHMSGGYSSYSEYSRSMHEGNAFSSIVLKGITETSLFNIFRAFLWLGLGALPFLLICLLNIRALSRKEIKPAVYGIAASAGCLGVASLYLCTHPGYIAAALPGFLLAAAVLWGNRQSAGMIFPIGALIVGVGIYLAIKPFRPPENKLEALANGVFLQYGAEASRNSLFRTTAAWLQEAGLVDEIPKNRQEDLELDGYR